jgi:general stress protein 26
MERESISENNVAHLWELIKDIKFAMLTTRDFGGALRSRPMVTQQADFDGSLWFFNRVESPKSEEIEQDSDVCISYVDHDFSHFVSVTGLASLVRDQNKINELWRPSLEEWFPKGKDDPSVTLIKVRVVSGECWRGPSNRAMGFFGRLKDSLEGPYEAKGHSKVEVI